VQPLVLFTLVLLQFERLENFLLCSVIIIE